MDPFVVTVISGMLAAIGGLTSFLLSILWSGHREHAKRIRAIEIKCASLHGGER
jgi:hypothetical protein